jgi:hypothetical protein
MDSRLWNEKVIFLSSCEAAASVSGTFSAGNHFSGAVDSDVAFFRSKGTITSDAYVFGTSSCGSKSGGDRGDLYLAFQDITFGLVAMVSTLPKM